jgi:hypothetical protein
VTVPQLEPLLKLVRSIEGYPDAADIAVEIKQIVGRAASPSMAQNACEHIISMCHPKAWGDRYVSGMRFTDWLQFLSAISDLADKCQQGIYDANSQLGPKNSFKPKSPCG